MNYDSQRWKSLVACMLAAMCAGFGYAWSVLLKPLISMYGWSMADVSLSFTLIMSSAAITAVFAGKAQDYFQPRQVILLGGALFGLGLVGIGSIHSLGQFYLCVIIAGIGLGMVYPGGSMSNLVRFFPDKSGLVSGLLSGGYGSGAVIWAPIAVALIAQFGVTSAIKIMGIFFMICVAVFSRLVATAPNGYRPTGWTPAENIKQAVKPVDKDWRGMLKEPLFWFLAVTFALGEITGMMIIGHASPIAQDMLKMTPAAAAAIVGILAVSNTGGRIVWGWISDKIGRYTVIWILLVLGSAAMGGLCMVNNYYSFTGVIVLIGLCYGGYLATMAPITAELFGTKNLGVNYGIMFMTIAVAAYVGPNLASIVKEANNGDYTVAFLVAVLMNIVGLVSFGAFMIYRKRKKSEQQLSNAMMTADEAA